MPITQTDIDAIRGLCAGGVAIATTVDANGKPWGAVATAFSALSVNPPLGMVCIERRNVAFEAFKVARRFAVNVLTAGQQALAEVFARQGDGLSQVRWSAGSLTGSPIFEGVLVSMECRRANVLAGGDHTIFVGNLENAIVHPDAGAPLLAWRGGFRALPEVGAPAGTAPPAHAPAAQPAPAGYAPPAAPPPAAPAPVAAAPAPERPMCGFCNQSPAISQYQGRPICGNCWARKRE